MVADDEDGPRRTKPALRDLGPLSVEELTAYIAELDAEIVRARQAIEHKKGFRQGAESLFRS